MAASLEEILTRRLGPDNDIIEKANADLKEVFNDPVTLRLLYQILGTSSKPEIRQSAAELIKKKILKPKQWLDVDDTLKNEIKGGILQLSVQEQEEDVRAAIAEAVAVIARHDIPTGSWPALQEFIFTRVKDEDPAKKETGMFVLSSVTSSAAKQMKPVMMSVLTLLGETLNKSVNTEVSYLALKSLRNLVFYIRDPSELKPLQAVVPKVLELVQELVAQDEEKACDALSFFVELLELGLAIIVPHLKPLVQYCLQVAGNKDHTDILRVKAMLFIATLINLKMETVVKHNLLDPILQLHLAIICDDDEEDFDDQEDVVEGVEMDNQRPPQFAVQIFDSLGHTMEPKKLLNKVMPMLERCLASEEAPHRRAAYLVLATVVEDCGEYIMAKMMSQMVQTVCTGLNDSSQIVRYAALFAVGQFAQHLQPDICEYASTLLPVIFSYLNKSMDESEKYPKRLGLSHFALDMFCEQLGEEIMPYLPGLMSFLLNVLQTCPYSKPKELAIMSVGTAASAAKENLQPYFDDVLEHLKKYLTCNEDDEDMKGLQAASIYTLAALASNIGEETFGPIAEDYLDFGLNLLNTSADPKLRRCVYSLFASISSIVQDDMAGRLEKMVKFMLASIKSTEGNEPENNTDEDEFDMDESEENEIDEEEVDTEDVEDKKFKEFYVENEFDDEKEGACLALGEFAKNCGSSFWPYVQQSYTDMHELITSEADGVRKAAFTSLGQFCQCMHDIGMEKQSAETAEALEKMIVGVVPKYLEAITDLDVIVIMAAVVSIQELLATIGKPVLDSTGATKAILTAVKDIFTQNKIPVSAEDRALALGTLAEVMKVSGEPVDAVFAAQLHPILMDLASDRDDGVRNNCVFATGMLAVSGGPSMAKHYPEILKKFSEIRKKESNPSVLDNVCGAVCRMIHHSPKHVPIPQVFPVVMELLPLKEDLDENMTVFTCLENLYAQKMPELVEFIPKLLNVVVDVVESEDVMEDTQQVLAQFVQNVKENYPSEFDAVRASMETEAGSVLDACLAAELPS